MKHNILSILLFTVSFLAVNAANQSAASIIEKTVETIRSAPSLSANLAVITAKTIKGSITLAGDKFAFSSPEMSTWFDGTTLWSYSADTQEVNLSNPTNEELQEINPFAFIKSARSDYKPRLLSSDAKQDKIELTPKVKRADLKKIEVTINKTSKLPTLIVLYLKNSTIKIQITNAKIGKRLSGAAFQFNKAMFPKAEIIDLR